MTSVTVALQMDVRTSLPETCDRGRIRSRSAPAGIPGLPIRRRQTARRLVGVEAARVRQDPQFRAAEPVVLTTLGRLRFGERLPIGREAEHGDNGRLPAPHVALELDSAFAEFGDAQLLGTCARGRNDVGDADPEPEHQFAISLAHALAEIQQARGDAGHVQCRPETVAPPGEVSVDRSSPQPRVDPDEQETNVTVDEVVHHVAMKRGELFSGELHVLAAVIGLNVSSRGMKNLYLAEHDCFVAYYVLPGHGPVHVYLPPLICPASATLLQVATHSRLAGRASILVDYVGCGLSDRPLSFSHTMRDHARTVAAILDHEGVKDCVVVGHSMGGTVGLHLALDRPDLVARLVLGESNVGPGGGDGTRHIASFSVDEYVGTVAPNELIGMRHAAIAGDTTAAVMLSIREHGSDARAVHAASRDIVDLDEQLLQRLLDLTIPRVFMYGARTLDELGGRSTPDVPDRAPLKAAGVLTLVVADAGHFMYLDNLDGYVAALLEAG